MHQRRQRIGVVLIFAATEAVPRHVDTAAEAGRIRIAFRERGAIAGLQQVRDQGMTVDVEIGLQSRPVERGDLLRRCCGGGGVLVGGGSLHG
ncbi:hypothetical protein ACFJIW_16335 [Tahibacter sp. UC22_41]|uniref:hypothetical protein n=1 Tax=Tahibacter sp. UC22_41 TaxID=3350178 RepID=UPI0036D9318F